MICLPFIYFVGLFIYFHKKDKVWNLDQAATWLLICVSFFAIMIDINDLYGDYGINEYNITLPTLLLFCLQWTMVLYPLHLLSNLPLQKIHTVKKPMLMVFLALITFSSIVMIINSLDDIKEALIMDVTDVSDQHYKDLAQGAKNEKANYFLLLPNLLVNLPFPTLALLLWFYTKSFIKCPFWLRFGIMLSSIVQAILSIRFAGRSAIVYWAFDFFIIYSFFYQYLAKKTKRIITFIAVILGSLVGTVFMIITFARFDISTGKNRSPFDSIYGYAGQHINNFCHMFMEGGDSPFQIGREFPLIAKMTGNQYDLYDYCMNISTHVKGLVNVFSTFGGDVYLDLGWFGYLTLLALLGAITFYIRRKWTEITFDRVFFLAGAITFFVHGIFAWPFTGHYSTLAIMLMCFFSYCFRYKFKI